MRLKACIICEDIRREVGNKHSLMGIYDDAIIFHVPPAKKDSWPRAKNLAFFIRIVLEEGEDAASFCRARLSSRTDGGPVNVIATADLNRRPGAKKLNIIMAMNPFLFHEEGEMAFRLDLLDGDSRVSGSIPDLYTLKVAQQVLA